LPNLEGRECTALNEAQKGVIVIDVVNACRFVWILRLVKVSGEKEGALISEEPAEI
jgi:hypothetical protein